ncbi:MAG: M20/M25/M40 family metallo-hydrolase [Acidobacteria bacterium]|nr:M20/M25/M40 family metallo-hydrolase [Acidobacteriota bacterium]
MYSANFTKISRTVLVALVALCMAASGVTARQQQGKTAIRNSADAERLRAHIAYLASDQLEGRKTGTRGAGLAAEYVAAEFARLNLLPGGSATETRRDKVEPREYMQAFPYIAGVELGKGNLMTFTSRPTEAAPSSAPVALDLRAGEDWLPLGFSANAHVRNAPVAFVGYGITAADLNYDDYAATDVAGKIALAIGGTPDGDNPHGKFTRAGEMRFKAAAARAAGASALVLIAREDNFKDDKLARLAFDNTGGDAGLPVVVVSRQAAARILGLGGAPQLAVLEKTMLEGGAPAQRIKANLNTDFQGPRRGVALIISTDVVRRSAPAANVVGILRGTDPKLKDEVIVVGAHYDHLGHGGQGSLASREGEIHHGADDNASGTAALIELARLLSAERDKLRRTVVFIAFGGEEEGLLGSSHYVAHPSLPVEQTVAMLNMDMVGRLKDDTLVIGGVGTATQWRPWLERTNRTFKVTVDPMGTGTRNSQPAGQPAGQPVSQTSGQTSGRPASASAHAPAAGTKAETPVVVTGSNGRVVATAVPVQRFTLRLNEDGFGPSDHSSFYAKRLPVLFFFTGTHEDYHKPSDTAERINYEGLARVADFVRELVGELQSSDARPTFTVAKTETNARSTGFRVYLGTIPSYGETTDGLKLDGVREGSPAESAGLKAGDLIVRLAGRDVRNVYDYTQALSEMKAGQPYEVEVVRDTQRMTLKITPAARK